MDEKELEVRLSDLGLSQKLLLRHLLLPMGALMGTFFLGTYVLLRYGVVVWGVNVPVAWGLAIINFVWWIGIGHAGTFISAILLLLRQNWRNSINRLAESMTLMAVACAGVFPILHLGRPWYFYWLFPYPNRMDLYPQYRSPLVWDAFAVTTYMLVSLLFWFIGLLPDFAIAREKSSSRVGRFIFSVLSLGWSGELKEWAGHRKASYLLALLATPLVVSVHSIVAMDFAAANVAGWHSPFLPPYFVSGAIYSGFAMVIFVLIFVRRKFGLKDLITIDHLEKCAKFLLISGSFVTYCYLIEFFTVWYGEEYFELQGLITNALGKRAWIFWCMLGFNCVSLQLLWSSRLRRNEWVLLPVSCLILIGMWLERYVIVVNALSESFLPAMSAHYTPTIWDWCILLGTIAIFATGLLTVLRFLPFIPITEIKEEVKHGHS